MKLKINTWVIKIALIRKIFASKTMTSMKWLKVSSTTFFIPYSHDVVFPQKDKAKKIETFSARESLKYYTVFSLSTWKYYSSFNFILFNFQGWPYQSFYRDFQSYGLHTLVPMIGHLSPDSIVEHRGGYYYINFIRLFGIYGGSACSTMAV